MDDRQAQDTAEAVRALAREVAQLRLQLQQSQPGDSSTAASKARANLAAVQKAWHHNVHSFKFPPEADSILDALMHESTLKLEDLGPRPPHNTALQPWFTYAWKVTFLTLRDFLATCAVDESSKASLTLDSFSWDSLSHERASFNSFTKPAKHAELWDLLRTRITDQDIGEASAAADRPDTIARLASLVPSRTLRITDLSPLLSSIVLASVPLFNQNIVAAFFNRYLVGANTGFALLRSWSKHVAQQHAFVFEYHLSFVYVPNVLVDPDLPTFDFRRLKRPDGTEFHLRRANAFGISPSEWSRWIFEEQCSCLIVGCGPHIQTSIQLAENYYTGPFVRSYGRRLFPTVDNQPRPAAMFLDWLQYAMHLVNGRWQQAIDAVNSCIHTSSDIIFVEDHHDLLSDDPQFSRSKTYFWALQAYKMFDEKLGATIDAWSDFRDSRLVWVNDGLFADGQWEHSVARIQSYVDALEAKRVLIQSKSEEVRHLRDGLFGASSLFDSRTAVRQGDNIRLLTWITILFFPLTFCTSIFGMQVVLPALPIRTLIITMPCVFVGTAFILLNTSYLMDHAERFTQWITDRLRARMKGHHHHTWKVRLDALQRDKQNQDAPVRRVQRQSSHWTYAVFALTLLLIDLPVHEVEWALALFWLMYKYMERKIKDLPPPPPTDPESASSPGPSRASSSNPREPKAAGARERTREVGGDVSRRARILQRARTIRTKFSRGVARGGGQDKRALLADLVLFVLALLLSTCRILLLLIWLPLVFVEYIILLPLVTLDPFKYFSRGSGNLQGNLFKQPLQWLGIGVEYKFEEVRGSKVSTFKQAVITWRKQKDLWEASDGPIGNLTFRRLRQRRPPPAPPPPPQDTPRGGGLLSGAIAGGLARAREMDRHRASSVTGRLSRGRGSSTDLRSLSQGPPSGQERGRSRQTQTLNVTAGHGPGTPTDERLSPGWRPPLSRSLSRLRSHPDEPVRIEVSGSN